MNFRTVIPVREIYDKIDYRSKILSLGSCFAENIGEKLNYFKFQNTTNPFGIIFNPVSLEKLIIRVVEKNYFSEEDIFFHNDLWHCYEVHSELSNPDKEKFLQVLNEIVENFYDLLFTHSHFIITFGTSWVYKKKDTGKIVANCHKVPQKEFEKELLSIEVISKCIEKIVNKIKEINNKAVFIFTISPVRHMKDGFVENNISKAHLIAGLHSMIGNFGEINYFPSYEIMMDELRDYRFYGEDMLHPSKVAIDYIWEKFKKSIIAEETFQVMKEVETIQKALAHKPFNMNSESYLIFVKNTKRKINVLKQKFPLIDFK